MLGRTVRNLQGTWLKFLRATLSVVLVFAWLAGSVSHARNCDHSIVHLHDAAHHSQHDADDHAGTGEAGHVDCDPLSPKGLLPHTDCTDLVCNGGIALLYAATVLASEFSPQVVLPWDQRAAHPVGPGRLDRPPKSLAAA